MAYTGRHSRYQQWAFGKHVVAEELHPRDSEYYYLLDGVRTFLSYSISFITPFQAVHIHCVE